MGPSEAVSSQVEQITRPPSRGEWPLAGRTEELARLADILSASQPTSVVLVGPAGVGKTRLAREALALAEQHRFATAVTTASRAAASIPLGAFAPLLPVLQTRPHRGAAVLQAAVRSIAQRGNGQPVVLVVDDAHLLDDLSATVVQQLAAGDEACVVATVRTGEPVPDAVVNLWKDQAGERIDLTPLDQVETETLLTEVLDGPVDGAALHDLWHASQGNVLYLRELVQAAPTSPTPPGTSTSRRSTSRSSRRWCAGGSLPPTPAWASTARPTPPPAHRWHQWSPACTRPCSPSAEALRTHIGTSCCNPGRRRATARRPAWPGPARPTSRRKTSPARPGRKRICVVVTQEAARRSGATQTKAASGPRARRNTVSDAGEFE